MIQIISQKEGYGKTKQLVDLIHTSEKFSKGNVIAIQKSAPNMVNLPNRVRLLNTDDYHIQHFPELYGFLAGLIGGNYDIDQIYIDDIFKICGVSFDQLEVILHQISVMNVTREIKFVVTLTDNHADFPESLRKYL